MSGAAGPDKVRNHRRCMERIWAFAGVFQHLRRQSLVSGGETSPQSFFFVIKYATPSRLRAFRHFCSTSTAVRARLLSLGLTSVHSWQSTLRWILELTECRLSKPLYSCSMWEVNTHARPAAEQVRACATNDHLTDRASSVCGACLIR